MQIPGESEKQRYNRYFQSLKNERSSWDSHWRELAQFFLPRRGRFMLGENRGGKKHGDIINGRPLFAARTLSSGLMAGLTSPARPWFRITVRDQSLAERGAVKVWLSDVEQRMRDTLSKSNLYQALPVYYHELGVFGTAAMAALEDDEDIVRFQPFTIGSYWLAQNSKLRVDTFAREFRMTVRQLVDEYGLDSVSQRVRDDFHNKRLEHQIDVLHLVTPNNTPVHGSLKADGMPWRSVYWERGGDEDKLLRSSGFRENPMLVARWTVTAEDIYGSSPGMDGLGDAKALQVQEKRKAMAIDKWVDPPMIAPGELRNAGTDLLPGGISYVNAAGPDTSLRPAYQTHPQIGPVLEDIQELSSRVDTAFYADMFIMMALSDRREITAREIEERHEEKLLMLGPVLERLNDELLDPLIDRVFSIMVRAGQIPPAPPELQGQPLKIEYISVLAQAQRMVGLAAVDRFIGFVGQVGGINEQVLDKVDWDQAVDEYAASLGVPPRIVVDAQSAKAIREQRAQQQQMAQMAQMAEPAAQAAGAVKDLSQANMDQDSALRRALETAGAA